NSVIEHAITAVQVGTTNSNAGGLIRTIEATFLNCRVGVEFKPYALAQFSTFENSKWITNQKLKDSDLLLGSMVFLKDVKGTVIFKNCTFVNSANWYVYNMNSRQTGIHCTNSSIKVENSGSATMPYVSTSNLGRAFYRLKSGIVYSGTSTSTLSVTKMAFDECNTGLQATNATGAIINDNLFDVPISAAIPNIKPRGSILTGCTGFSYERNALQAASFNAQTQNVGSMFVNCGVDNNLSYRNTYSNLWKGQEVQGNNADPLASIGLQLRCNTYTNCQYDQYLGDDDYWRNNQGDVDAIGNLANNRFSMQFPSCAADKYDMYISPIRNYGTWFFDYFVPNSEWYIPNSFDDTYADCSSPHIQVVVPGAFEDNTNPLHTNICLAEPLPSINSNGIVLLQEKQDAVLAARANYQFVVDKNEKEYLLNNINSAFPSESGLIKDLLLQKTPLSDEVMKAFITKIDNMDPWHVTQVLLANAPLTKDVLYALENSESLSGFFMNFIYEAQAIGAINLRKLLELEISARETDKHLTFVQLMSQADSLLESSALQTEYASLMEKYGTDDAKKWQLEYLRSTNPTLSAEIFSSLADKPQHKDWAMLKNIEWSIPDSVETLDSITFYLIEEIAFNPKSDGYPLALALLEKYGYDAVVAEPEIPLNYRSMQLGEKKGFQITPIEFEAFPNPASTNTFVTYPKEADGFGYIEFWNNQGMLLKRELCAENGIKEVNLEAWSSGVYLLKLVVNEKQISSLKIVKL
ncbi:MAG: T9SS type A sorting domain-containing protein, partial [Flavobacteriales bacterium]